MQEAKLKLDVFVGFPSYGGNGGISSEVPDIREWWAETIIEMRADPRVGRIITKTIADTPITHVRNRFVHLAEKQGCHLLLMIDSDQSPNKHKGEPGFKPFWTEAFDFIYKNYSKGPHVVGAPYCGPPGGTENVYVFKWENEGIRGDETQFRLDAYSRSEAAIMSGIQECAALPTGMILYDMRAFDLIRPSGKSKRQVLQEFQEGKIDIQQAEFDLHEGYFYYEWTDSFAHTKASTEDVTNTRDISMCGQVKLGYNPVHCAWDSWIGHWKPWNVGRPMRYGVESIGPTFRKVVLNDQSHYDTIIELPDLDIGPQKGPVSVPQINAQVKQASREIAEAVVIEDPRPGRPWFEQEEMHPTHVQYLRDFVKCLGENGEKPRVLEVGSWLGGSAIAMADAGAIVHCVDTWEGSTGEATEHYVARAGGALEVYEEFKRRVGGRLDNTIFPWRKSSKEAFQMPWAKFDLIFIDAQHSYSAVREDIIGWWQHIKAGGFLLGHDYKTKQFEGLTRAVGELFDSDAIEEVAKSEWGSMFLVQKWAGVAPKAPEYGK